jgi:hypothetical protein
VYLRYLLRQREKEGFSLFDEEGEPGKRWLF